MDEILKYVNSVKNMFLSLNNITWKGLNKFVHKFTYLVAIVN